MAKATSATRRDGPGAVNTPRQSLADTAYEALKRKLLTLEFEPGSYLNEAQVAETLGIGRNPVHNAVKRLVFEGMIDVIPRKGLIVRPLNLREILEIAEARLINESFCVRRAAERASASDIADMRKILANAEKALAARDVEQQMFLDRDFHCAVFRAAKNSVLEDILRVLHERSLRNWFVSLKDPEQGRIVLAQHTAVLDAIEAQDPDTAEREMCVHVEASRDRLKGQV